MRSELQASTAITDGIVAVPGVGAGEPGDEPSAAPIEAENNLPANKPHADQPTPMAGTLPGHFPYATGPPQLSAEENATYWHALINEKLAAAFLGVTARFMQAKRQHGDGAKFVRISQRCIRYTRYWLKTYADEQLRSSTSDHGKAA